MLLKRFEKLRKIGRERSKYYRNDTYRYNGMTINIEDRLL